MPMITFASAATAETNFYGATSIKTIRTTISTAKAGETIVISIPTAKTPEPTSYATIPFAIPSQGIATSALPVLVLTNVEAVIVAGQNTQGTVTAIQTPPASGSGSATASKVTVVMAPSDDGLNTNERAAVGVAAVCVILLLIGLVILVYKERNRNARASNNPVRAEEGRRSRTRTSHEVSRQAPSFRLLSEDSELAGMGRLAPTRQSTDTVAPLVPAKDGKILPPLPAAPVHLGRQISLGGRHDEGRPTFSHEAERMMDQRRARYKTNHYRRRSDFTDVNLDYESSPYSYHQHEHELQPRDYESSPYSYHQYAEPDLPLHQLPKTHPSLRPPYPPGTLGPMDSLRWPVDASSNGDRRSEETFRTARGTVAGPSKTWYNMGGIRSVSKVSGKSEGNESQWEDATTDISYELTEMSRRASSQERPPPRKIFEL